MASSLNSYLDGSLTDKETQQVFFRMMEDNRGSAIVRSDDRCAFVALVAKPVSRAPRPRATGQADQKLLKSQYIGPSDPDSTVSSQATRRPTPGPELYAGLGSSGQRASRLRCIASA